MSATLIKFACPSCEKKLSVDASEAGKHTRCKCGTVCTVPDRSGSTKSVIIHIQDPKIVETAASAPSKIQLTRLGMAVISMLLVLIVAVLLFATLKW